MRVYKRSYKTKSKKQFSRCYVVEARDHLGTLRKYSGFSDKRLSLALGERIELLADFKRAGQPPDALLSQWLECIPEALRTRLAKIGLIDMNRAAAGKPLSEHLNDYRQFIGDITKYAKATHNALVELFGGCKFVYWSDIQASRLYNQLVRLKSRGEISQSTFNAYLKATKSFCSWMVQDRRASESPIAHLKPITVTEREVNRRALEDDELHRFLETTARGTDCFGMGGGERYLLYRFAIETGLRANEIRNLTVGDFDFNNRTVTVQAGSSKHRRQDVQALKSDTAKLLKEFLMNKTLNTRAFGGTYKKLTGRTAEMIKEDLERAEISYIDEAGRVFDFHALRHQTGSMLARYGVHPRDAQAHMRHSDINLTMRFYTHLRKGAESETAAKLPDLSLPKVKEAQVG